MAVPVAPIFISLATAASLIVMATMNARVCLPREDHVVIDVLIILAEIFYVVSLLTGAAMPCSESPDDDAGAMMLGSGAANIIGIVVMFVQLSACDELAFGVLSLVLNAAFVFAALMCSKREEQTAPVPDSYEKLASHSPEA